MPFGIIAPIVGAAVGIYGANKQANAAKSAQQERNNATDAQYEYNKEMGTDQLIVILLNNKRIQHYYAYKAVSYTHLTLPTNREV